jgi:hypothetical protein
MKQRLHGSDGDHPDLVTSMSHLARVLELVGDVVESTRLHRESVTMLQRLLGTDTDHPAVATLLSNLARVLQAQGELTESARLYRQALAMERRMHGADADHPSVATSLNSLAVVVAQGQWPGDLAECAYRLRECVAMRRRLCRDEDSADVAAAVSPSRRCCSFRAMPLSQPACVDSRWRLAYACKAAAPDAGVLAVVQNRLQYM